ncbi:hypothetical protein Sa4125_14180 [Aureimonas sp. SA4125]|uniref:hypothetical protein n=1 Tax=Aureimonas sp. SA4125 TaxID=2826993 RepID=UPI001CC33348|nr:hypothetical protein [Aureimonas sp. SA4125]BDA83876.1 hypothetical protein Sa4125_14180 [Aureimonas sp. SA4125]
MPADREHLKSVLEAAKIQIDNAVQRVDAANTEQLAEIKGLAHIASAFVDFNSGCGKGSIAAAGHEMLAKLKG